MNVRPDGGAIEWIDVLQRPDLIGGGFFLERDLITLKTSDPPRSNHIVASDLHSAGWLARSLLRQAFGENGAPWFICVVTARDGCVRSAAVDPKRSLNDPAGSPDGRRVAAVALATKSDGSTPKGVSGPVVIFDARNGKRLRDLTHGHDLEPAFSPDGATVAFVRGRDLYTVPARGRANRLARGVASPSWSKR